MRSKPARFFFGGGLEDIFGERFAKVANEIPNATVSSDTVSGEGLSLLDALVESGLSPSWPGQKDIQGGGVNVNNNRIQDLQAKLTQSDVHFGKYILLRRGKRTTPP